MGKPTYRIWRLNPEKRVIAPLALDASKKDFSLQIQRICRASKLGHDLVCEVEGARLCVAADGAVDDGTPGFRFIGSNKVTAGIAVLFGQGAGGGLMAAPVDKAWLERHLIWMSAEEVDQAEAQTPEET